MAKEKKNLILRIDKSVIEQVERWAVDEFRSTNGQLEWIIVQALKQSGRYKPAKGSAENRTDPEEPKN